MLATDVNMDHDDAEGGWKQQLATSKQSQLQLSVPQRFSYFGPASQAGKEREGQRLRLDPTWHGCKQSEFMTVNQFQCCVRHVRQQLVLVVSDGNIFIGSQQSRHCTLPPTLPKQPQCGYQGYHHIKHLCLYRGLNRLVSTLKLKDLSTSSNRCECRYFC